MKKISRFALAILFLLFATPVFAGPPMYAGSGQALDPTASPTFAGETLTGDLTMTGATIETAYATVASHATTSAIWAAAGNIINFTGNETITALPAAPQAGAQRVLICAGTPTFTHNGTTITVQGGATYTAAAGDVAVVTATTTTAFKINIFKQDGKPIFNLIASSIADSDTTHAPDGNSVFDALAGKQVDIGLTAKSDSTSTTSSTTAASSTAVKAAYDLANAAATAANWPGSAAVPPAIGSTTPAAGAFTTLKMTTGAAAGNMLVSDADGDLGYLSAGATTDVLVGGGAANPVWTAATGTGAPVRATSPTLVTPLLGTPTSGDLRNTDMTTAPIIGKTAPAELWGSPVASKGPAIITTFAGTVTATASTTVTFSEAADAILAGYSATNPILGTTLISNALTRYIVSWTNATTAVVDSAVTWAGTAITSAQLPIRSEVNSAGVAQGWMNAAGKVFLAGTTTQLHVQDLGLNSGSILFGSEIGANTYYGQVMLSSAIGGLRFISHWAASDSGTITFETSLGSEKLRITPGGNVLTGGLTAAGASAAKVVVVGGGTMPNALVADAVQMGVAEYNGATGDQRLNIYSEATVAKKTAIGSGTVSVNGAVTSGGGFTRQLAEAVSAALSGASGSIAVNVPSGARILGVQLRVDTAVTSGDGATSWTAAYVNTPTTAICSGQAFAKSTKFNAVHPAYEVTTGTVTITITPNSNTFSGGVIRAIVYYEAIDAMIDAP